MFFYFLLFHLNNVFLKSIQTIPYKFPPGYQPNCANGMYKYVLYTALEDKHR